MTYEVIKDGDALTVTVWGSLDINSSPELESAVERELDDVTDFTIDFAHVTYVSSMGLRLLLSWQKRMFKQGSMQVINVSDDVMDTFDITGFTEILDIR